MLERLSKSHRNIALIALGVLLAWFGWTVRSVLNPLILGYLLAYILRPMVQRLEDKGFGRRSSVNIIFALFAVALLLVGGAVFIQARQFVGNQITLAKKGEDPFTRVENNINALLKVGGEFAGNLFGSDGADGEAGGSEVGESDRGAPDAALPLTDPPDTDPPDTDPPETESSETRVPDTGEPGTGNSDFDGAGSGDSDATQGDPPDPQTPDLPGDVEEASGLTLRHLGKTLFANWFQATDAEGGAGQAKVVLRFVQRVFGDAMNLFAFLMLLPVYTYFLLFELERIHEFIRSHVPKRERDRVTRIGRRVGSVVANFFRGRLLICFLKGLVLAVGLTLLQVPYGVLLGIVSGFMSLIPFVGPIIGFVLTLLASFQQVNPSDSGLWLTLGLIGGVFMLAEIVEGYILIPKILGDTLGLHPVVILLSVFVGGAALGLFGFLIAIPLAATLIILFRELVMPALADIAEEDSHTDGAPGEVLAAALPPSEG